MPELTLVEATTLFARRRDAWLAEDVEAYLACFAADLVITVPGRLEPIRGIEAYERLVRRPSPGPGPVPSTSTTSPPAPTPPSWPNGPSAPSAGPTGSWPPGGA